MFAFWILKNKTKISPGLNNFHDCLYSEETTAVHNNMLNFKIT